MRGFPFSHEAILNAARTSSAERVREQESESTGDVGTDKPSEGVRQHTAVPTAPRSS